VSTLTVDFATLTAVLVRATEVGARWTSDRGLSLILVALFGRSGRIISGGDLLLQSQHTMQHDLSLAYLSGVLRSSIPNEFRRRTGSVFLLEVPRRSSTGLETWFELDLLVCDRLGISAFLVAGALDSVLRSISSATGSGLP
jgi:hypothetical protein